MSNKSTSFYKVTAEFLEKIQALDDLKSEAIQKLETGLKKRDEIIKELMKNTEINLKLIDFIMPEIKKILEGK